jgi:hypothetical protein
LSHGVDWTPCRLLAGSKRPMTNARKTIDRLPLLSMLSVSEPALWTDSASLTFPSVR